jgi:hypothetical protein
VPFRASTTVTTAVVLGAGAPLLAIVVAGTYAIRLSAAARSRAGGDPGRAVATPPETV